MENVNRKIKKIRVARREKRFYEEQWFWMAITIIVICLTRGVKIITCGNGNGNNGNGNTGNNDSSIKSE